MGTAPTWLILTTSTRSVLLLEAAVGLLCAWIVVGHDLRVLTITIDAMSGLALMIPDEPRHHSQDPEVEVFLLALVADTVGHRDATSHVPVMIEEEFHGTRERPEVSSILGVFGLSSRTADKDLEDIFRKYGRLQKVTIIYDHRRNQSRGFGFVYFENQEDATRARDATNGLTVDNHRIRLLQDIIWDKCTTRIAEAIDVTVVGRVQLLDIDVLIDREVDLGRVE
ncbi:transformer 2 beta [Apophysomyces ossiformis]|uniref:Transformer 2 beta n=1 Tax=Apophysomyces ossiformis TaxID=679940 RepID=A0A8H7BME5_9FUNG|nr:transformer 2 beta [Apophysomyces ossiformis]